MGEREYGRESVGGRVRREGEREEGGEREGEREGGG